MANWHSRARRPGILPGGAAIGDGAYEVRPCRDAAPRPLQPQSIEGGVAQIRVDDGKLHGRVFSVGPIFSPPTRSCGFRGNARGAG